MYLHKNSQNKLYCFSPPVMIATFAIEIAMAVYVMWRYRLDVIGRLIVATLCFLALFQFAEFNVCGGYGLSAEHWSRIGYVAITTLPPLGLHIMHVLAGRKQRTLVVFAYLTMIGFIIYFLTIGNAFRGYMCTGNYVIFQLGERASIMYGAYYYGWLLAAMALGIRWLGEIKLVKNKIGKPSAIRALIAGYLVFLLPTALANTVNPETRRGIPSIMCGFAILFAIILVTFIAPRVAKQRKS